MPMSEFPGKKYKFTCPETGKVGVLGVMAFEEVDACSQGSVPLYRD
jgi:hypothetical protein